MNRGWAAGLAVLAVGCSEPEAQEVSLVPDLDADFADTGGYCTEAKDCVDGRKDVPAPVLYWSFDAAALDGTAVSAGGGTTLGGTAVGDFTTTPSGMVGEAGAFDGVTTGVTSEPWPQESLGAVSVSVWLWLDEYPLEEEAVIVGLGSADPDLAGFRLTVGPGGKLRARVGNGNPSEQLTLTAPYVLNRGRWGSVVFTFADGRATLFSDDLWADADTAPFTALAVGGAPVVVGFAGAPGQQALHGRIDEVGLFDVALDEDQRWGLFNNAVCDEPTAL